MGIIKTIKGMLPNKLTAAQRASLKGMKLTTNTGKTAIKEAGKTIRSTVSNIAANRTIQQKLAADATKQAFNKTKVDAKDVADAIRLYENIIKGNPDSEGEKGRESTTNVGGSGSAIGG